MDVVKEVGKERVLANGVGQLVSQGGYDLIEGRGPPVVTQVVVLGGLLGLLGGTCPEMGLPLPLFPPGLFPIVA